MPVALRIVVGLFAVMALTTAAFFATGPVRVWTRLAGPADQGPVDLATLQRRTSPNDALACTPGLCAARADRALPVFPETPAALIARLDEIVLSDTRNLLRVDDGSRPTYRRYVARTPIMRYPDTVDAVAVPSVGGSGLAIYSRSQMGKGDWGVNRARIEGWVRRLGTPAGKAPVVIDLPVS